jgi:Shwachman-Bodian-Diamond syndrome (SBDS) protein
MTRGESTQFKVHYKGKEDDFVVFVDDVDTYKKWQSDKSIAMAHFMSSFKVFITHKYVPNHLRLHPSIPNVPSSCSVIRPRQWPSGVAV